MLTCLVILKLIKSLPMMSFRTGALKVVKEPEQIQA